MSPAPWDPQSPKPETLLSRAPRGASAGPGALGICGGEGPAQGGFWV